MPRKRLSKICGNCSTQESLIWYRQRGNNKFLCQSCQDKKLATSNRNTSTEILDQSQGDSSSALDIVDQRYGESISPSTIKTERLSFPANLDEETSDSDELGSSKTAENIDSSKDELIDNQPEPNLCIDDETTISQDIEPKVADLTSIDEKTKLDEHHSTNDETINIEEKEPKGKRSPISHPRLTRLRRSTRPIRAATLASNKSQSRVDKCEKQSHSRSSSSTGFTSKSVCTNGAGISSGFVVPRNKGRRHIFKLVKPDKSLLRRSTTSTYPSLWHKGQMFRQSDVVAVIDEQDENVYYASIRGLLRDEYCQQYAVLTWLIPSTQAPLDRSFDLATYVLGPEDETFYALESLEFVCHVDVDHFKCRGATLDALSASYPKLVVPSPALNPKSQFAGM